MHLLDLKILHLLQHELHLWLPVVPKWFLAPGGCAGLLVATMGRGLAVFLPFCHTSIPRCSGCQYLNASLEVVLQRVEAQQRWNNVPEVCFQFRHEGAWQCLLETINLDWRKMRKWSRHGITTWCFGGLQGLLDFMWEAVRCQSQINFWKMSY